MLPRFKPCLNVQEVGFFFVLYSTQVTYLLLWENRMIIMWCRRPHMWAGCERQDKKTQWNDYRTSIGSTAIAVWALCPQSWQRGPRARSVLNEVEKIQTEGHSEAHDVALFTVCLPQPFFYGKLWRRTRLWPLLTLFLNDLYTAISCYFLTVL